MTALDPNCCPVVEPGLSLPPPSAIPSMRRTGRTRGSEKEARMKASQYVEQSEMQDKTKGHLEMRAKQINQCMFGINFVPEPICFV